MMEDFEKEIEEVLKEKEQKDITQEDKVDESVDKHLGEMGFLWEEVNKKLQADKVCFKCKKELEWEKDLPHVLVASKTEPGVVAFVCICDNCVKELKTSSTQQVE